MKKKLLGILFIFFVIFYSAFTYLNSPKITYLLKGEKCSDSKFLDNTFVLTGVNGNLTLINTNSGIDKKLNINSSWIDCLSENDRNIIIYSNINKETGLFITNKDGDIISNNIIFNNENLCIDPSIYKFNNTYFITSTEIEGNIS